MLRSRSAKKKKARKLQLHPEVAAWLVERRKLDRFGAEPQFTNPNAHNDEGRWKEGRERRAGQGIQGRRNLQLKDERCLKRKNSPISSCFFE